MLNISAAAAADIRTHAEEGYPFEICGFLVGRVEGDTRSAAEAWRVSNAWEQDPEQRAAMFASMEAAGGGASAERWLEADAGRRFLVSPRDILDSMKRARAAGMDLIGVYHTHPNHPAVPSDFDRSAAWPEWSYVILAVREGQVAEFRSWVVLDDGPFTEESVIEV
jgi:proteasome lid subunit RPN8/RPN11